MLFQSWMEKPHCFQFKMVSKDSLLKSQWKSVPFLWQFFSMDHQLIFREIRWARSLPNYISLLSDQWSLPIRSRHRRQRIRWFSVLVIFDREIIKCSVMKSFCFIYMLSEPVICFKICHHLCIQNAHIAFSTIASTPFPNSGWACFCAQKLLLS